MSELDRPDVPDRNAAKTYRPTGDMPSRTEQTHLRESSRPQEASREREPSEKLSRQDYADSVRRHRPCSDRAEPDDVRTAPADQRLADPSAGTGSRHEARPDSAEPRSREEYSDAVRGAPGAGLPERITIDGHEIEVTHNRRDGLWVGGLPGQIPDRIGDLLASPDVEEQDDGDRFLRVAVRGGDDLIDSFEKNIDLMHDGLARPPTHAEVPVSVPGRPHEVPHHELDTGNAGTAVLTLGLLTWAAGEWITRKMRGPDDDADHG